MKARVRLTSALSPCKVVMFLTGAVCLLSQSPSAHATHIPLNLDRNFLRGDFRLPQEGYLKFRHVSERLSPNGEERTGWTDIRHPVNDGTTNTRLGYDRSNFFVEVHSKIVTVDDQWGIGRVTAQPNMARDFNYANQIWAQAGISVLSTGTQNVDFSRGNLAGNPVIREPIDEAKQRTIQQRNRVAPPVVNNWYASSGGADVLGMARFPAAGDSGTMVFNNAANDTFAHELGHFLLDTYQFNNPNNVFHSPERNDLMAPATNLPDNSIKDVTRSLPPESSGDLPADHTPNNPRIGAPRQPGRNNGPNLGIVDHFEARVRLRGAGEAISQIRAVHESPFVQRDTVIPGGPNDPDLSGFTYGNLADFDWVEDNFFLSDADGKADNHPGFDPLVWEIPIADLAAPDHSRHDHRGLFAGDEPELTLGRFRGDFFRTVDVISQILRYADMDARDGNWNAREAALDYSLQFSADGINWVDPLGNQPIDVFVPGWTRLADADNWVARWVSPVDARFVRIAAMLTDGHDGNTQIDAIIASPVIAQPIPEPSTLMLLGCGILYLSLFGWRRRRRLPWAKLLAN
ncbi:MAG: PEP-CTERM sorting domain-containing protein [Abditibacteriales bacterium]|nr:PEP-CTERM sorting domain-containing protein [Abditibacteriales bacterium]